MVKNSRIEWTDHTFNPWWGCTKKSAACKNCYAEAWAKRVGQKVWGKSSTRRFFSDNHWRGPLAWDRTAELEGQRHRVFCASMADVFEDRRDLDPWRERLARLINDTPNLDWLLLTKRPEMVPSLVPWGSIWPANVWLGTTIESQREADRRLAGFVQIPARVRFLSCEPLLSALDLSKWIDRVHWIIAGGESGGRARPMDPNWARGLRDQCIEAGIPFHFKQWGNWAPATNDSVGARRVGTSSVVRVSKKIAGRELDGRHWNEVPTVA